MKKTILTLATAIATGALIGGGVGCRDDSPPPPRTPVPAPQARYEALPPPPPPRIEHDPVKPLPPPPPPQAALPPMPYDDEPLVNQRPPEQGAFVDAYNRVNRPRITVFVNRTLEGDVIPVNPREPEVSVEQKRTSAGNVQVQQGRHDSYTANGPASYKESTDVYLHQGQYDEAWAKSLDYEALEAEIADWLSSNGQVTIISPTLARQRLTDEQVKDLQSGRPQALSEVAQQLGADILVQVQAHPTQQYADGLRVRMVVESMNTHGGESLGRVVADVPLPLEKTTMNKFTRFVARKLMDDMTGAWLAPPAPNAQAPNEPAPNAAAPQSAAPPSAAPSAPQPSVAPQGNSGAPSAATATPAAPVPPPLPAATSPAH